MIRLALRNLFRRRARSGLALAALVFGVVALLQAGGFMEWIFWAMRESTIASRLGHIQVVRPGFFESGTAEPFAYLLPESTVGRDRLAATPHVEAVAPRLYFSGLASRGDVTVSFVGEGVEPDSEARLSRHLHITRGARLDRSDARGVILGRGLAASLGVEPGDTMVLLATTAAGGINAVEVTVRGVFYTSTKAFDDSALRLPIAAARELLRVEGAHSWVVLLDGTERTDQVLQRLRERFAGEHDRLEFVPWYQLADFYNKTVVLFSRQMSVVWLLIAVIIVLGISNTLVMAVLERTGEIGTMMALGERRRRVLQLFLSEGLLLGLIGGAAGLACGWALARAISAVGIPMPPPPGMDVGFTGEILVTWPLALGAFAMAVATAALAGLYPAWKASRMEIVAALRRGR